MKKILALILLFTIPLISCSGSDTIIKKNWDSKARTIYIQDLTNSEESYMDASSRLLAVLEESIVDTIFVLDEDNPVFKLKFKVTEYQGGSRFARLATLGASNSARAKLQVKAALYQGQDMLGAWEVNTWINGGMAGGSEEELFDKAADEIITHMKGSY